MTQIKDRVLSREAVAWIGILGLPLILLILMYLRLNQISKDNYVNWEAEKIRWQAEVDEDLKILHVIEKSCEDQKQIVEELLQIVNLSKTHNGEK